MEATLPALSYILSGETVKISVPSGVPVKETPKVYTFPLLEILVGVVLAKVAIPPVIDKIKSVASKAPVPPFVL